MNKSTKNHYSSQEDDFIKANYHKISTEEISKKLNRTRNAIIRRAFLIGATNKRKNLWKKYSRRLCKIYNSMKDRCYNLTQREIKYKYWGGKGIGICDEWLNNKIAFLEWAINNGYTKNLSLDRIESNGNYEPNNCQWVTKQVNCSRTIRKKITQEIIDEIRTSKEKQKVLMIKFGLSRNTIWRYKNNDNWFNEKKKLNLKRKIRKL